MTSGGAGRAVRSRGHRPVPHTADVILEAWGPDRAACFEEAVAALAAIYAEPVDVGGAVHRAVHVAPGTDEALLLGLLDEVIFALDTDELVPVGARVATAADGGLDMVLLAADRARVRPAGSVPKAVSRSELAVASTPDGVRCRFLVDV